MIIFANRINESIFVVETALRVEAASTSETSVTFYRTVTAQQLKRQSSVLAAVRT
jgi:hypothetical protein